MTARIARGAPPARRPAARPAARKRKGKAKKQGLLDGLPISPRTMRLLTVWGSSFVLAVIVVAALLAFRVPQRVGTALGEQVGAAGFKVTNVEVRGLNRMNRSTVYRSVLNQPSLAMPLIDLDAIRSELLAFPWIKEARVSRRLPDTLVVEIIEREPAAVWQMNRRLQLVDAEGVGLGTVQPDAMPALPLVIGPGAQQQVAGLHGLIETAPQLRPLIAGSTWVGGRRWDVRFTTGETLSLPEGEGPAKAALRKFAEMNERRHLLGSNFVRFDMRIEGKMIVQLRNAPAGGIPAIAPGPAPAPVPRGQAPQDLSRTI